RHPRANMDKENQPEMAERKHAGDPGRFLARPISLASYPRKTTRLHPSHLKRANAIEDVNAKGINAGHQPAVAIVRPAAAAPPRRPYPVDQRHAAQHSFPTRRSSDLSAPTRQYG